MHGKQLTGQYTHVIYTDTIIQFTDNTENSKQYGKHKEKQNDPWTSIT